MFGLPKILLHSWMKGKEGFVSEAVKHFKDAFLHGSQPKRSGQGILGPTVDDLFSLSLHSWAQKALFLKSLGKKLWLI